MMNDRSPIPYAQAERLPRPDMAEIRLRLAEKRQTLRRKIVVLDDDPTGIQTVHGVSVYTGWTPAELRQGFAEEKDIFFILTNSRAFSASHTRQVHREIACHLTQAAQAAERDFILISRGDSTLRGHYPLETEVLREQLEQRTGNRYRGEIIMPFFHEGGRLTIGDIHYVREGDQLIPVGETEFARDKTFGFSASDLKLWCEEKTAGRYPAARAISISLKDLRELQVERITSQLMAARDFQKIIVNAADYCDVEVFALSLLTALEQGGEFLLRTAAAAPKILGGIPHRPLLTKAELTDPGNPNGGLLLVGSHVQKTTRQLEALRGTPAPIDFIEFNQHLALEPGGLQREAKRVTAVAEKALSAGRTAVVYTRRQRLDLDTGDKEKQLKISVEISEALTGIIGGLSVKPSFLIAKGGITSSDVGTKALGVKRATAMGQVRPGVPVWMTGQESRFPGMPYVIFPGNVGTETTLREVVEALV